MNLKQLLCKFISKFIMHGNLKHLSDELCIKIEYYSIFGKKCDLNSPKTFNEKLQWLKLYDRNPKYTNMVDKYEAKEYVSNIIGEEYIIPTIGIYNNFNEINFSDLPEKFIMKCTHDSGSTVICENKALFDVKNAEKKINKKLRKNYYYATREWPYKNIKPRIIVEKYLENKNKEELIDYKFMCFNGKVKCSFVCLDRRAHGGLKVDFYDLNWKKMPFQRHYPNSKKILPKPQNYELMLELAEKLAMEIPFVRVDFYEINGKVYFGELTFFPGAGLEEFTPQEYDKRLGDLLDLSLIERKERKK